MWIRVDTALRDHRKMRRLARRLGSTLNEARGAWLALLCRVKTEAPDGFLDGWEPEDVADAMDVDDDPEGLVEALVDARLLDAADDGAGWYVHNWLAFQPDKSGDGVDRARSFIIRELAEGRTAPTSELYAKAKMEGLSSRSMDRARAEIGVRWQRDGRRVVVSLPTSDDTRSGPGELRPENSASTPPLRPENSASTPPLRPENSASTPPNVQDVRDVRDEHTAPRATRTCSKREANLTEIVDIWNAAAFRFALEPCRVDNGDVLTHGAEYMTLAVEREVLMRPDRGLDWWRRYVDRVSASRWCRGEVDHPRCVAWGLRKALDPSEVAKVERGERDDREPTSSAQPKRKTVAQRLEERARAAEKASRIDEDDESQVGGSGNENVECGATS